MDENTDVSFRVMCLDEDGNARKHSIEIKNGKIRTQCRRARCEEVRRLFLYYSGFSYAESRKGVPRALAQHLEMCARIRWHRKKENAGKYREGWKPLLSERKSKILDKLYPMPVHWSRNMGFRAEQMLFLHSFFRKQAPDLDWYPMLSEKWSRIDLPEESWRVSMKKHWTILVPECGEELVLTFSCMSYNMPSHECGFWFRKKGQQYSCSMSPAQRTGRPYHVSPSG